jgi:hypothetical protein
MTDHYLDDPDLQLIAGLTPCEPDHRRAERIRARCRARVVLRRAESVPSRTAARRFRLILAPSGLAVACIVFLCEVARRALLLYGF